LCTTFYNGKYIKKKKKKNKKKKKKNWNKKKLILFKYDKSKYIILNKLIN